MAEITVEKRKSSPYPSLSPSLKIEFEDRKRILFHINSIQGLPSSQVGWQPVPSIFVSVESLETKESYSTEHKKHGTLISWGENMPLMDLRNTSKVRFEIKSQVLWKNKITLGSTDVFDVADLLEMQNRVGNSRDDFIELNVPFKSSKSPNSVLTLSIREMAMKDHNAFITAADHQRFVEVCQRQSLEELRNFVAKMVRFRKMLNVDDTPFVCIVDIILGVSEGVYKIITNPITKHINKNTVAIFQALSEAFTPYENVSARHLAKKSEDRTELLREMLCGAVKAFESVINFLRMPDRFVGDKLEFKVTHWIRYFEECARFLLVKDAKRPTPQALSARRVRCPSRMVANSDLPTSPNTVLPMELPNTYPSGAYDRPDLVKLIAEWIFSPASFAEREKELNEKGKGKESSERVGRLPDQDRERNNSNVFCLFGAAGCGKTQLISRMTGWLGDMGCLGGYFSFDLDRSPTTSASPTEQVQEDTKTTKMLTPSQILDALPITLVHQLSIVEPDMVRQLTAGLAKNSGASSVSSVQESFEKLFVDPLREFEKVRVKPEWNPLEPLVFVIDGIGGHNATEVDGQGEREDEEDALRTISTLADLLSSKAMSRMPKYVKFLVLCRSGSGLGGMLKARGAGYVYEVGAVVRYVEPASPFSSPSHVAGSPGLVSRMNGNGMYSGSSAGTSGGAAGGAAGGRTSNPKFSIQAF